jgi:hypothetical protein
VRIYSAHQHIPSVGEQHRGKTSAHAPNYENMAGNPNINSKTKLIGQASWHLKYDMKYNSCKKLLILTDKIIQNKNSNSKVKKTLEKLSFLTHSNCRINPKV